MARVTVEDCLDKVDNRFQLVLVATKRARQLANGVQPLVEWENDKPTIVALREIAAGLVGPSILEEPVHSVFEEPEEEAVKSEAAAPESAEAAPQEAVSPEPAPPEPAPPEPASPEAAEPESAAEDDTPPATAS